MKKESLKKEQEAFDHQIVERIKNGHVPDLRFNKKVKYFYNNVWRDPYLVKHTFGITVKLFNQILGNESKILEIGCGPGHMSLELARLGHKVYLHLHPNLLRHTKCHISKQKSRH